MPPQPKVSSATNANLVGSGEYQNDGISAIDNGRRSRPTIAAIRLIND